MASIQQTPQGPVLVLKESALQQKGRDAQQNNITAAKLVADLVKSSLGPRGLDKMLVDSIGDVTITNDGATILKEIDIQHPAAKMMVEISKTMDNEVGDGTTSSVVFAGALLEKAEQLLKKEVHSSVIIDGYQAAADKTLEIGERLHKRHPEIKVLSNAKDRGFGNVLKFGFSNAKYDYVLPVMADLCDDPNTIPRMISKINEGFDVVVGSRYMKGGNKKNVQNHFKSFISRMAGVYGHIFQGIPTWDTTNAFKIMKKSAINSIELKSNNFDISLEALTKLHKKGYKIAEVPTTWTDRSHGSSKFIIHKVLPRYIRWCKSWK